MKHGRSTTDYHSQELTPARRTMPNMKNLQFQNRYLTPLNESFPEIPKMCFEKLLIAIDKDMDQRVSFEELLSFIQENGIHYDTNLVERMFEEASKNRGVVHEEQKYKPLGLEEIMQCVQQRRQFNQERQQWEMVSRVYREQWIRLLKLVNEHIYPPKHRRMLPQPIVAQYEYPIPPKPLSYTQNFGKTFTKIKEIPHQYKFQKGCRTEANLLLRSSNAFGVTDNSYKEKPKINALQSGVNRSIDFAGEKANKISFESQEYYGEAKKFSTVVPWWKEERDHPIFTYLPEKVRQVHYSPRSSFDQGYPSQTQITSLGADKNVLDKVLKEGPRGLKRKKHFKITFTKENCFDAKRRLASFDPVLDEYIPPSNLNFRNDYIPIPYDKPDFQIASKCPLPENPLGISAHDRRPKENLMREEKEKYSEENRRQGEYMEALGLNRYQKPWHQYIKIPNKQYQMSGGKRHEVMPFEEYLEPRIAIARQLRDDMVFGKPIFRLHCKGLKPEDLNREFGGIERPFKVLEQ